jgi:hypothetical protein
MHSLCSPEAFPGHLGRFTPLIRPHSLVPAPPSRNPFRITSFADPHPLTPIESHLSEKQGRGSLGPLMDSTRSAAPPAYQLLSFHTIAHSFALAKSLSSVISSRSALFTQNTRGGYPLECGGSTPLFFRSSTRCVRRFFGFVGHFTEHGSRVTEHLLRRFLSTTTHYSLLSRTILP